MEDLKKFPSVDPKHIFQIRKIELSFNPETKYAEELLNSDGDRRYSIWMIESFVGNIEGVGEIGDIFLNEDIENYQYIVGRINRGTNKMTLKILPKEDNIIKVLELDFNKPNENGIWYAPEIDSDGDILNTLKEIGTVSANHKIYEYANIEDRKINEKIPPFIIQTVSELREEYLNLYREKQL